MIGRVLAPAVGMGSGITFGGPGDDDDEPEWDEGLDEDPDAPDWDEDTEPGDDQNDDDELVELFGNPETAELKRLRRPGA